MARKKPLSKILVSENTLGLKECTFLIDLYDRYSELSPQRDYSGRPLLHYYTIRDVESESASWVYGVSLRCKEKIEVDLRYSGIICRIGVPRVFMAWRFAYSTRRQ